LSSISNLLPISIYGRARDVVFVEYDVSFTPRNTVQNKCLILQEIRK